MPKISRAAIRAQAPTARDLLRLEQVYVAEVEGRLPFQPPAARVKAYNRLAGLKYIEPCVVTIPAQGPWGAIVVKGWQLTHLGRMEYCASCGKEPDEGSPF